MPEYELCRVDQLVEGRGRPARAGEHYLAVFLVGGQVHVLENRCLHVGSPLDGGPVEAGAVRCPWHGWSYDLESGDLRTAFGPRPGIRVYPFRVEGGSVKVILDEPMGD